VETRQSSGICALRRCAADRPSELRNAPRGSALCVVLVIYRQSGSVCKRCVRGNNRMLQDRTERTTLQANLAEFCRWTYLQTERACQLMSLGWDLSVPNTGRASWALNGVCESV